MPILEHFHIAYREIKSNRHLGGDSCQAFLPGPLRVNANLFQTDLCRDPDCRDALKLAIRGFWIPAIPAGMTRFPSLCGIDYDRTPKTKML
ncbi:hypothetical protein [Methylomicrobium album]|uniref:hypothetical protein n=1 Tax=Methylomicrobium album TaxID=39775 RepID=UPI001BC88655|nr:hypothetical protein [Methylomicrobium album]